MLIRGWTRDYLIAPAEARRARETISATLSETFTADDGATTFKSASFSHVVRTLRYKHQKMPGRYGDQRDVLEALGFKIVRGRSEFPWNHGKFRRECDCVVPDERFDPTKIDVVSKEEVAAAITRIVAAPVRSIPVRRRRGIGSW